MGTDAKERGWQRAIGLGLFLVTVLLFSRAIGNAFVNYDDPDYVTGNVPVQSGLGAATVSWALTAGTASNWHPLTWLSHALDVSLFGLNPRGHHATSVLLHGLNAALVFFLLVRLTGARWTSAVAAALWAWHPLRVESVAWVAERKDVLSGLFWFVALLAYATYVEQRRAARPGAARLYVVALVAFALGLMAKPMLVTLPCVLVLLDVWPLRRWPLVPAQRGSGDAIGWMLWEKIPFFALSVASSVVTYLVQERGGSVSVALTFGERVANAFVAVVLYLANFVWPFDLAVLYPHPGTWPTRQVVACVAIIGGLTALAVWQWRRRPWLAVGWGWFLGTLVPVIGLVQVGIQSRADRYTYLPILGLQLAVLWTVRTSLVSPASRRAWGVAAAAGLALLAARTWDQTGVWRDSYTLFDHALAVTKHNYLAYDNRGFHLAQSGRYDEAMADYQRALAIKPDYLNANNNFGHALQALNRPADAVPWLRRALATNPQQLEVRNNLANALSDTGQLAEAAEHYDFVLAQQPRHVNALNGSAVLLAMQNRLPEARARLERSLEIQPNNPSALNNLGNVCAMQGERDVAIGYYRRAAVLNPAEPHPYLLIGSLLNEQEKYAAAADSFRRALALRDVNPEAHAQLGFALARLGRRDEAMRSLQIALQQRPDFPQARAWYEALAGQPAGK